MAASQHIHDLYERHIKALPVDERLRLAALIQREAVDPDGTGTLPLSSDGAQNWHMGAVDYVYELRREHDRHL